MKIKYFALFLFTAFGILSWGMLSQVYAVGDVAGDMLTANRIKDEGYLLVGHWSVWQFNHPGPFWFYYNAFFEFILKPLPLSRLQTWFIGSLIINSAFIIFSARTLSLYFLERVHIFYCAVFRILGAVCGCPFAL